MQHPSYVPSFYFQNFVSAISEPYTSLNAYSSGAIDANGNLLKPESSIDPFEYFVIKLKKIFEELPPGMTKAKLGNYLSAFNLFTEAAEQFNISKSEIQGLIEAHLILSGNHDVSFIELSEDMGAASMATPGTSPSYNTGSVSGYDAPMRPSVERRKPLLQGLDNCSMFDVCPEEFKQFKGAKSWKNMPDTETSRYIRRFQNRNPKGHVAVRSVDPDTGRSNFLWVNLSPTTLGEEFNLDGLLFND